MKKMIALFITTMMLLSLVSCSDTPPDDGRDYSTAQVGTWGTTASSENTTAPTETEAADHEHNRDRTLEFLGKSYTQCTICGAIYDELAQTFGPPVKEKPAEPEPTLTVSEEIDWEHKAVKITLTGDGKYYFTGLKGEYVENYKYELGYSSVGNPQAFPLPMESPVVAYIPISSYVSYYLTKDGIDIAKVDANGKIYHVDYEVSLNLAEQFSDEPITLQDEFLHAAMTSYFGGEYSERDLLEIRGFSIDYDQHKPMSHDRDSDSMHVYSHLSEDRSKSTYYAYSKFFDTPVDETPNIIPAVMFEDFKHFHALEYLVLYDKLFPEKKELYKQMANEITKKYEVTENTWSK